MGDLDDLILSEVSKDKKEEIEETNKKLEHFIVKKKINIVRTMIKKHLRLMIGLFSLILVTIPLSFLIYDYYHPKNVKINTYNENSGQISANKKTGNSEINQNGNKLSLNNKTDLNQSNKINENEEQELKAVGGVVVNQQIEQKRELIKNSCGSFDNLTCIVNLAVKNKDPGFCVFYKDKNKCLSVYEEKIMLQTKEGLAKKLALELLNGTITIEDVRKYNLTAMDLIQAYPDPRLCKYLSEEEKKELTLCQ